MNGGGGPPGRHRIWSWLLGVAGGSPGRLSRRPDQDRGLRQPPLLRLPRGFPRASWGDGGAGAGPAVVAVVPLGLAIGVGHHSYPDRCAWLQASLSYYLPVHRWRAMGGGGWCRGGERSWRWPRLVMGWWPSTGNGAGGW